MSSEEQVTVQKRYQFVALTLEVVIKLRSIPQLFLCQDCGVLGKSWLASLCWQLLKFYREEEKFKQTDVLVQCFQLPVLHSLTSPYILT